MSDASYPELFTLRNFEGTSSQVKPGKYPTMQPVRDIGDNAVNSIKVPAGFRVRLYQYEDFGGCRLTLTEDTQRVDFNQTTSSIQIEKIGDVSGTEGVNLFSQINFGGSGGPLQYNVPNLSEGGLGEDIGNDNLSSLRIPAGYKVTLWSETNYQGEKLVLTEDTMHLSFRDTTSSLVVEEI
ncbi:hypothetical protein ACODT5_38515 [Streptomyces sp. 5.8]|uniref:hypothetical protein n=1 Tax=Streptomyces sp. 5.8 TaxID=3406571 RepID=UPI003BB514FD